MKSKVLRCAAALGAIALSGGLISAAPVAAAANNCQYLSPAPVGGVEPAMAVDGTCTDPDYNVGTLVIESQQQLVHTDARRKDDPVSGGPGTLPRDEHPRDPGPKRVPERNSEPPRRGLEVPGQGMLAEQVLPADLPNSHRRAKRH